MAILKVRSDTRLAVNLVALVLCVDRDLLDSLELNVKQIFTLFTPPPPQPQLHRDNTPT
jgi:hypothetical protein